VSGNRFDVLFYKKAQLSLTKPRDAVEIRVIGHSRSFEMTPFDRSYTTSY